MTCEVFKAQPTVKDQLVTDLHISAVFEIPEFGSDYREAAPKVYDEQGKKIVDALVASLPGGTVDAVLRHLLFTRASILRVTL